MATISAPLSVMVTPVLYSASAGLLVRVHEKYLASAPLRVRVNTPTALPAYQASAGLRVSVNRPASNPLTYPVSAPLRVSVNNPLSYFKVYRTRAPFKVSVNGAYAIAAPLIVKVRDNAIGQGSRLTTATPVFWTLKVSVNGMNVTARITGEVTVDATENAATVAAFSLLPYEERIDPTTYIGQAVTIDYNGQRRFTGLVDTLDVDLSTSVIKFLCTDGLQLIFARIEGNNARIVADAKARLIMAENDRNRELHKISVSVGLTQQQINSRIAAADAKVTKATVDHMLAGYRTGEEVRALVGGIWTPYIFSSNSGWDAFHDCMSTQLASYNLDSFGNGVNTPWAAKETPDFTFTADHYVDGGLKVNRLANASAVVNSVDLKFESRFTRLFEYGFMLQWAPGDSYSWCAAFGTQNWGNCDHKRVADAITGAGFCVRADKGLFGYTLAVSQNNGLHMSPVPGPMWVSLPGPYSTQDAAYLSDVPRFSSVGSFTANVIKRYKQARTDTVIHTIQAPQSIAQVGRVSRVVSHAIEMGNTTDAQLARTVDRWEETVAETFDYPVSRNGVAYHGTQEHGGYAGSTTTSVPLSLNRYTMAQPLQKPDNNVKPTLPVSYALNWDITRDQVNGLEAAQQAFECAKAVAVHTIVDAHRQNQVSVTLFPAHETIELSHTVQFERERPYFRSKGKVSSLSHRFDIESGEATTEVTVSLVKPWATGVHYVDPYIPLPDVGTIVYPGTLFTPTLSTWPPHDYNLRGMGAVQELATEPPETMRFRGYNYYTGNLLIEAPPTPQEAAPSFSSVTRTSETVTLPDDLFLMDG